MDETVCTQTLYRIQFFLAPIGTKEWRSASIDEVNPRSWIIRCLVPAPIEMCTSKHVLRAHASKVIALAKPKLEKRGRDVDFDIVTAFTS